MNRNMRHIILAIILVTAFSAGCGKPGININFDGNGSTSGKRPVEDTHYKPGETVTVPANSGSFAKPGLAFAGWNTLQDGTGTLYIPGTTFTMGSSAITLYAMWTKPGTVEKGFCTKGADDSVYGVAVQPDGKILVGGAFEKFNGTTARHVVRLNADGSVDKTFNTGSGPNFEVVEFAFQPDGKIVILGNFFFYDKKERNRIARLNPDGSLDESFNPGSGFQGDVRNISLQKDGKMILAGWFTSYNGGNTMYLIRLNSDGSVDRTFNTGAGPDLGVFGTAVLPDGKIIIAGRFTKYNNVKANCIARLNPDGSLDTTFNTGEGPGGTENYIMSMAMQKDGKIIIAGYFTLYNGTERNRIARLNPDGSLDKTFEPGMGADHNILKAGVLPDGRVLASGWFHTFGGEPRKFIALLNSDGKVDKYFGADSGPGDYILGIAVQADNRVIAAGDFRTYNGVPAGRIVRLWN